jgi:poly(3-hydroxybutyrate) depolymerase
MFVVERSLGAGMLLAAGLTIGLSFAGRADTAVPSDSGVMKVRSHYTMNETIDRLKHNIAQGNRVKKGSDKRIEC